MRGSQISYTPVGGGEITGGQIAYTPWVAPADLTGMLPQLIGLIFPLIFMVLIFRMFLPMIKKFGEIK